MREEDRSMRINQLNRVGQQILEAARDELYLGMRFLDVALSSLVYQMDTEVTPFGTDGAVLYFHPGELGGMYRQNRILVNRGYLHIVYHCLFRHILKVVPQLETCEKNHLNEGADGKSAAKEREIRYWNLACDIAVECLVDSSYHRSVRFSQSLLRREVYRRLKGEPGETPKKQVLNAERIYQRLLAWQLPEKELGRLEREFSADDHRYWENRQPDQTPPNPELNRRWQEITERMETDLETFSKEASEKSGELLGQLMVENRKRQDYREFLKKFSVYREETGVDADTFDYTFYSYGLSLYGNMPLIEPQETREVKKVQDFVVVLDTSMSCSGEKVREFLEITYGVLSGQENFFKKVNVHILQCDEEVQSDVKITDREELRKYMDTVVLYGEGGTDFRPAFAYVDELLSRGEFEDLRGLVYFTDGYGVYPKQMPAYQTAFVFLEEDYPEAEVPAWAVKTVLEVEEQGEKGVASWI